MEGTSSFSEEMVTAGKSAGLFGHVTRLQILVLAILLGYLLIFS